MSIGSKGIYLHRDSGCRRTNTTSACKAKGRSHTERLDKVEADDEENISRQADGAGLRGDG